MLMSCNTRSRIHTVTNAPNNRKRKTTERDLDQNNGKRQKNTPEKKNNHTAEKPPTLGSADDIDNLLSHLDAYQKRSVLPSIDHPKKGRVLCGKNPFGIFT